MRTIFVPNGLNLLQLIGEGSKKFSPFNPDHLKYILHIVSDIESRNKDKYIDGWVPLNTRILITYVRNYQHYLNFLIANGILECDNKYIPAEKSRCYRFAAPYREEPLKEDKIEDAALLEKLSGYQFKSPKYKLANTRYGNLTRFFKSGKLRIDHEGAVTWLRNNYPTYHPAYKRGILAINNIHEGNWNFITGSKGGRLYTTLTTMKRELRNFLTYDGQRIVEVDIKSSQPYFLLAFFQRNFLRHPYSSKDFRLKNINHVVWESLKACKNDYDGDNYITDYLGDYINMVAQSLVTGHQKEFHDFRLYRDLIQGGGFYEYLSKELIDSHAKFADREEVKDAIMWIYNGDQEDYFREFDGYKISPHIIFEQTFPSVNEVLYRLKGANYRHVSWLMHGMESKMVLDIICKKLSRERPEMPLFTIHDCIATTIDFVEILKDEMMLRLEENVGVKPVLKVKNWESKILQQAV